MTRWRYWAVAQEPGREVPKTDTSTAGTTTATVPVTKAQPQVSPYYLQMRLPGESDLSYVAMRTFVPFAESPPPRRRMTPTEDRTSPR